MTPFASTQDLNEKKVSFDEIGAGLYAYTAEGDPNTGVIVGDDAVMVIDAQATPALAGDVIARIAKITDKPVKYVLLTHYHAARTLGASAFKGAEILASDATRHMIVERGNEDMNSEIARFPRLFRSVETVPGLTWPTITFPDQVSVWLGRREVRIIHVGRGHTAGDVVAIVPDAGVVFSGDLVEYKSACYCGDAHFVDWLATLDHLAELQANALVPGRGAALTRPGDGRGRNRPHRRFCFNSLQFNPGKRKQGPFVERCLRFSPIDDGSKVQEFRNLRTLSAV